jgi:hypothetical protein
MGLIVEAIVKSVKHFVEAIAKSVKHLKAADSSDRERSKMMYMPDKRQMRQWTERWPDEL